MADPRVERLADVVVSYSTAVRPGDLVVVDAGPGAAPLVRETYRRVLAAGGHPQVHSTLEGSLEVLLHEGSDDQLEWISPARAEEVERLTERRAELDRRGVVGTELDQRDVGVRDRRILREAHARGRRAPDLGVHRELPTGEAIFDLVAAPVEDRVADQPRDRRLVDAPAPPDAEPALRHPALTDVHERLRLGRDERPDFPLAPLEDGHHYIVSDPSGAAIRPTQGQVFDHRARRRRPDDERDAVR